MADEGTEPTKDFHFAKNYPLMETRGRRLTMQQYVLQYVQVTLGREWPSFLFFFGGTEFTYAQYINIMYILDSKRQKFDV